MAVLLSQSAEYRIELLDGYNYFLWTRSMHTVLMSKKYWTLVTGEEFIKVGVPEEARLEYMHRAHNFVSTFTMAVSDHRLRSTTDTDDTAEVWREL